ncbi:MULTISPECIES: hypothetical protein [unclassified Haladaptatus]|uniref:hypothetical protein n=1 Tax=unclassified Haladaptatus TaxID=2622732 RepID=UPI0023E8CEDC|nr:MULTISPECIES: hypothetical protein [unclassified Haladaptatus]
MTDYTLHVPSIRGVTKAAPNRALSADDFETDDLADLDDYFLLSTSGIPPESFDDLYLPVAHLDQRLSLPLLEQALEDVETLDDIDPGTRKETINMLNDLAECFPNEAVSAPEE